MAEPLVAIEGVEMESSYGRPVFSGLTWSLPRGARVRVGAERGEGGTALLRLCAGLAHPRSGRVLLDGVPHAADRFDHPYLGRGAVAWIPQEGALVANLTLLENVALPLRFLSGARREEAEARALAVLGALGLSERARQRPHTLLRRERQLGAIARSVVMRAELWLWDRPLDELDADDLERALEVMEDLLRSPSTTILVIGDEPSCQRFAPDLVRLSGGRLVAEGVT